MLFRSVGLAQFLRFTAVSAAAFWWAFYAQEERGMSEQSTGLFLAVSGLVGALGFFLAGRLGDRIGRRPTFILYMAGALVTGIATFNIVAPMVMFPFFCLSIFFGLGSVAITSAMATEPFPTYVRSRASAWNRNAVEVVGGIVGALLTGVFAAPSLGGTGMPTVISVLRSRCSLGTLRGRGGTRLPSRISLMSAIARSMMRSWSSCSLKII